MAVWNDENKLLVDCSEVKDIPFEFKIFNEKDLIVSLINQETSEETLLTLHTDYEIEISRIEDGGTLKLNEVHPGYNCYAYREIPLIQPEEIPTEGNFPEETIENAFDRGVMISQQLQEQIDRCLKIPGFSSISEINFEEPQDGKALIYDIEGNTATIKNSQYNPDEVVEECQAQVALAEAQADRSELNAEAAAAITGQFPASVSLTTWARLNNGEIFNLPFDSVKADVNKFIEYADKRKLKILKNTFIRLDITTETDSGSTSESRLFCVWEDQTLNVEDLLDTGETLTNGKDYSIFLVPDDTATNGIGIKVSLNKTAPTGYSALNTRRIGGFHTLCVDAGTIEGHDLSGWLAGDILPLSVWTLWHRPICSPSGMRYVPELDGWKTIYMQSGTGTNTVFEYGATHTRSRDYWGHEFDVGMVGMELISSLAFTVSAQGVEPLKAIQGKAESYCLTAGGHVNESGRRILSNGGDEDDVGVLWQVTSHIAATGGSNWAQAGSFNDTKAYQYGSCMRLIVGGAWSASGYTGPSCRIGSDPALHLATDVGARGWCRPLRSKQ